MQEPIMSDTKFQRLTTTKNMPENLKGAVVAIGNFDGVHRGHQAVLQTALDQAAQSGRPALALTFEPHPRSFFKPDEPVDRLTPAAEKAELLKVLGFDAVIELPFTKEFSTLSAEEFVRMILVEDLQVEQVVTGYDFHFGKARRGTPEFLSEAGLQDGFKVTLVEAFCDEGGGESPQAASVTISVKAMSSLQQGCLAIIIRLLPRLFMGGSLAAL